MNSSQTIQSVVCSCQPGRYYERFHVLRLTEDRLEALTPSGAVLSFERPRQVISQLLAVVVDREPPVKQLNIGCTVLRVHIQPDATDNRRSDGNLRFVQGTITQKSFGPFMVQVRSLDGTCAWFTKDQLRTLVSPWPCSNDQTGTRRRRRKGDLEVTPHGLQRVSFVVFSQLITTWNGLLITESIVCRSTTGNNGDGCALWRVAARKPRDKDAAHVTLVVASKSQGKKEQSVILTP